MSPSRVTLLATLALVLVAASSVRADYSTYEPIPSSVVATFVPTKHRTVIDLSGSWERFVDGSSTDPIALPVSESLQEPVTYRKTVRIDKATLREHAWSLFFMGASDELELRVNGKLVQRYPGGLLPFTARIPERFLQAGQNQIELHLTPDGAQTQIARRFARFGAYAPIGITREVFLVGTPHVWVSDVKIRPSRESGWVSVTASISGGSVERIQSALAQEGLDRRSVPALVECVLVRADGTEAGRAPASSLMIEQQRTESTTFTMSVGGANKWSPLDPNLYSIEIRVSVNGSTVDTYTTQFGQRSLRTRIQNGQRSLLLNDTMFRIHAVDYVEGYPTLGATMSYRQMETDVRLMKTLGVNTVVFRTGAPHPYFQYLCDRYGLFVIVSLPNVDVPNRLLEHDEILARARNAAERTIAYYDTHPSVMAYVVSDGLDEGSSAAKTYQSEFAGFLRRAGTKLLAKTVSATRKPTIDDEGFNMVIVRSFDARTVEEVVKSVKAVQQTLTNAVAVACFGVAISPDNLNGVSDPLSTEAQAIAVRDCYRGVLEAGAAGVVLWTFADYRLAMPTMVVDHHDAYICTAGLVDEWRQPRVSYTMIKSIINDEKEPLLQSRAYSDDTPLIFIGSGLVVGLMLVILMNRSRRFREYLIRSFIRPYNFYADVRDQRILSIAQTSVLGVIIAACIGLTLASLLHYLRTNASVEYLLHVLLPWSTPLTVIRTLAWNPALSVAAMSVLTFAVFLVIAILLRIGAIFVRSRIHVRDTLTITVWSSLPLVALLPIGIALYQVLSANTMSVFIPVVAILLAAWCVLRILRATSVVFDVRPTMVYGIGLGTILVTMIGLAVWYDTMYETLAYLQLFIRVVSA
jgi:beta-galactosidase